MKDFLAACELDGEAKVHVPTAVYFECTCQSMITVIMIAAIWIRQVAGSERHVRTWLKYDRIIDVNVARITFRYETHQTSKKGTGHHCDTLADALIIAEGEHHVRQESSPRCS